MDFESSGWTFGYSWKSSAFCFHELKSRCSERMEFGLSTGEKMLKSTKLQGWREGMEIYKMGYRTIWVSVCLGMYASWGRSNIGLHVWRLVYLSFSGLFPCRPEVIYFLRRNIRQNKVSHFWVTQVNPEGCTCTSTISSSRMVPLGFLRLYIRRAVQAARPGWYTSTM